MLKQVFGRCRGRMVEVSDIVRPETGGIIEFFSAYTLHGDRWLEDPTWKLKSVAEARDWLDAAG